MVIVFGRPTAIDAAKGARRLHGAAFDGLLDLGARFGPGMSIRQVAGPCATFAAQWKSALPPWRRKNARTIEAYAPTIGVNFRLECAMTHAARRSDANQSGFSCAWKAILSHPATSHSVYAASLADQFHAASAWCGCSFITACSRLRVA